jgi:hypothetical protein
VTDATAARTVFLSFDTHDGDGRGVENVDRCGVGDVVVMGIDDFPTCRDRCTRRLAKEYASIC